jgi:hypothetical protein
MDDTLNELDTSRKILPKFNPEVKKTTKTNDESQEKSDK